MGSIYNTEKQDRHYIRSMGNFRALPLWALLAASLFASCDNYETYGDKKEKERNAINTFINDSSLTIISEAQFHNQGDSTSVEKREFVYLNNSGVYMQIVRRGCGSPLEENKTVNVLCRYIEYNILDKFVQTSNESEARKYDKMTVTRTGSNYTGTFDSGEMSSTYGTSVPTGWLIPLAYINLGRQTDANSEIAKVKLIVPHTQGQAYASSNVYPCYYIITYQREK